jgi:hypothetical protein
MKVKFPKGCPSVSHAGEIIEADENGFADISAEAFADLQCHGVVVAQDLPEDESENDAAGNDASGKPLTKAQQKAEEKRIAAEKEAAEAAAAAAGAGQ